MTSFALPVKNMVSMRRLGLLSVFLGMFTPLHAENLTPPNEPHDDLFYVCYKKCRDNYTIRAPLAGFTHHQYLGCVIQRTPCDKVCHPHCAPPHPSLHLFGQYNTYQQALNSFYMCAYSGSEP